MEAELGFWAFSKMIVLPRLMEGMGVTLKLTFISGTLGLILGMFLALMRISQFKILNWLSILYITLFRGTPLLLQILFIYFALPTILEVYQINMVLDSFSAGILALSLNSAAYLAEIFRAGILSIHKGQTEAARALGLSRHSTTVKMSSTQYSRRLIQPNLK